MEENVKCRDELFANIVISSFVISICHLYLSYASLCFGGFRQGLTRTILHVHVQLLRLNIHEI